MYNDKISYIFNEQKDFTKYAKFNQLIEMGTKRLKKKKNYIKLNTRCITKR